MAKTRYREILELGASDMQKLMPHSPLKSVLQQLCYEALDNPMANGIQIASP